MLQKNAMSLTFLMKNLQLAPCDAFRFVSSGKEHYI